MKTRIQNLLIALALFTGISHTAAQGTTAFTYQGQLRDGGTNANGTYTMIFKVYDAVTGGNQIGSTITNSPTLANGLFTVNLDFGASPFNGSTRWLDITITNGGTTQTLSPRGQVLATPYSLYSNGAGFAVSLIGTNGTSIAANTNNGLTVSGNISANLYGFNDGGYIASDGQLGIQVEGNITTSGTISATKFLGNGTGLTREYNILDFGGTNDGMTDNSLAFSNTIASMPVHGGILKIPAGNYFVKYPINFTKPVYFKGDGNSPDATTPDAVSSLTNSVEVGTTIIWANPTGSAFICMATNFAFRDMTFSYVGTTPTANSYALCFTNGYASTHFSVDNVTFFGGNGAIDKYVGTLSHVDNCLFLNVFQPLRMRNVIQPDGGDSSWIGNSFITRRPSDCAVDLISGGGQIFSNSKFNGGSGTGFTNFFRIEPPAGIATSDLIIIGNSMETPMGDAIVAKPSGGIWYSIQVKDNQLSMFGSSGYFTHFQSPQGSNSYYGAIVDGNQVLGCSTPVNSLFDGVTIGFGSEISTDNAFALTNGATLLPTFNGNGTFSGNITAAGFYQNSDRNLKDKFTPINSSEILERVVDLPISSWNYKQDAETRHIGPMAQDFYAAFNLGTDDKHIATVDEDGVALAAIQGLNEKLKEKDTEIQKLKSQNESFEKRLADLEQLVKTSAQK